MKSIVLHIRFCGICILSFLSVFAKAQTNVLQSDYDNLSYNQHLALQDSLYRAENIEELVRAIDFHTKKAKLENNNIEIARSYYYKTIVGDDSLKLKYADSIIRITEKSEHSFYPTVGVMRKANILFEQGKFDLSLQIYLDAYILAAKKENMEQLQTITFNIAAIRNINGQPKEAIQMYHKSLNQLKNEPNYDSRKYEDYHLLLNNIALSHLRLGNLDSAYHYAKTGLELSKEMNDAETKGEFRILLAQIDFYDGKFTKAIDSINHYIEHYSGIDKATKLYYLGKSHEMLGQDNISIEYYKEIDSIVTAADDAFDEIREVYQSLIIDASKSDNDVMQLEYIDKLLYFDSMITAQKRNVFNSASVGYDLPMLRIQKAEIAEKLNRRSKLNLILIYTTSIFCIGLVYFFIRAKRRQSKIKILLENANSVKLKADNYRTISSEISDEKARNILSALNDFERKHEFLDKSLDLPKLAEKLDTNTSYLSMVINTYKKKSFPNYLKELRIDYALDRISSDTELLKYNYQGLAEIFGFKSSESFSRAFYAQKGVYPSYIIKELKKKVKKG